MESPNYERIRACVDQLHNPDAEIRLEAAAQLGRLGVRSRNTQAARGNLYYPADPRLEPDQLNKVLGTLADTQLEVRREVAFALGEWGGKESLDSLEKLVRTEQDWQTRAVAADALAKIGGDHAVEVLKDIAKTDAHEDVRSTAFNGITNLVLATEAQREDFRSDDGSEDDKILQWMDGIRAQDSSNYVRSIASMTLASFKNRSGG